MSSPVPIPDPITDPVRWLKVDPKSISHLVFEDHRVSPDDSTGLWVTAHSQGGEHHRFRVTQVHYLHYPICVWYAPGIPDRSTTVVRPDSSSMPLILTAVTPAVGKWTEVDQSGEPIVYQRPVITVSSDRQIGKTDLLLVVAARDAVLQDKWVVYEAHSTGAAAEALSRFLDLYAPRYVIRKVSRFNGRSEVVLRDGGRLLFRWVGQGPWLGVADTHLVDDDEIPPWRYLRSGVPARIYHAVTTGDGRPL